VNPQYTEHQTCQTDKILLFRSHNEEPFTMYRDLCINSKSRPNSGLVLRCTVDTSSSSPGCLEAMGLDQQL